MSHFAVSFNNFASCTLESPSRANYYQWRFQSFHGDTQRGHMVVLRQTVQCNASSIFPFLSLRVPVRFSSLFCTRSDIRMAVYIMVTFVFSQVKMVGWQMDGKDRRIDEEKGRRSSVEGLDESLLWVLLRELKAAFRRALWRALLIQWFSRVSK